MVVPFAWGNNNQGTVGCHSGGGGRRKGSRSAVLQPSNNISSRASLAAAAQRRTEELKVMMAELATHFHEVSERVGH